MHAVVNIDPTEYNLTKDFCILGRRRECNHLFMYSLSFTVSDKQKVHNKPMLGEDRRVKRGWREGSNQPLWSKRPKLHYCPPSSINPLSIFTPTPSIRPEGLVPLPTSNGIHCFFPSLPFPSLPFPTHSPLLSRAKHHSCNLQQFAPRL